MSFFHTCTALLNGLQETCGGIRTWYFLILYNAVKLLGIKSGLTVFHSCFSTCLKQQVSLGQALMCFFAVMMTANCSGPGLPGCTVSEETRKMERLAAKPLVDVITKWIQNILIQIHFSKPSGWSLSECVRMFWVGFGEVLKCWRQWDKATNPGQSWLRIVVNEVPCS